MITKQEHALKEFNRLNKEINDIYHDICCKAGISDSVFDILYTIAELGDGCRQKDICNYAFISKQTIHSAIRKLEKEEFLTLKSGKGREMHIFLTQKGQQFLEEKILPIIDMENRIFSQMTLTESNELLRLTEKYLTYFREMSKDIK